MNWTDLVLNVALLALVPFFLAAYGGHIAADAISDATKKRYAKLTFWSGCIIGIAIAVLSQYRAATADDARNRRTAEAEQAAAQAQAQFAASDKANSERLIAALRQLNKLSSRPQTIQEQIDTAKLRNEIASAIADTTKNQPPSPPVVIQQLPISPVNVPIKRECRGDSLQDCTDEELLAWGKPLVGKIQSITNDYIANLKKLDEIKGGNLLQQLIGIGDKDSEWLKAYDQAQTTAVDEFRDCCIDSALAYHKELAQRTGGGAR